MSTGKDKAHPLTTTSSSDTGIAGKGNRTNALLSWSLLSDRHTDQEILQEMGLALLADDEDSVSDGEKQIKPSLKRKRDIENVNPNVNSSVASPNAKPSPKRSPKKLCRSPSPGPSKIRSPKSVEKSAPRPLLPSWSAEKTALPHYLVDEETPLPQHPVTTAYITSQSPGFSDGVSPSNADKSLNASYNNSQSLEDDLMAQRQWKLEPVEGEDSTSVLSDEMMLSVFKWLPKRTLAQCMLVSKRWHRVASDETFWQRLDLGFKTLTRNAIGKILNRKPLVVRLAATEIAPWTDVSGPIVPSRIQYLDLSVSIVPVDTLNALLERCPELKKLSLESVNVNEETCRFIGKCRKMETLNLCMARGITPCGLTSILEGCSQLQSLNLSWCALCLPSVVALTETATNRLQRLNIAGTKCMTDELVARLVECCPRLLELDLSDCARLSSGSVASALRLPRLEHLALSRCYLLPPHALTKLSALPSLHYLEVWGMLQEASLTALRGVLPNIRINQFMHSAVARPTVGNRRTSIWGFRTRD